MKTQEKAKVAFAIAFCWNHLDRLEHTVSQVNVVVTQLSQVLSSKMTQGTNPVYPSQILPHSPVVKKNERDSG
jgi:hypothetical protein